MKRKIYGCLIFFSLFFLTMGNDSTSSTEKLPLKKEEIKKIRGENVTQFLASEQEMIFLEKEAEISEETEEVQINLETD